MLTKYSDETYAMALRHKISFANLPMIINGCSGGLSWLYRVGFGKTISCEPCCETHDLWYHIGPNEGTRKAADVKLRECARKAGSFPAGWKGIARRVWRFIRAWTMYGIIRLVGRLHWNEWDFFKLYNQDSTNEE